MDIVSTFNPISATSGQFDMTIQQGGHLLVANESSANLILKFGNGAQTYVPANDRRLYCISGQMAQPHTVVTWTQQSTLPNPNIVNQTVIEAFQPGENVPETYPSPVIRNTSVAGNIIAASLQLETSTPTTSTVLKATDTNTSVDYMDLINGTLTLGGTNGTGNVSGLIIINDSSGNTQNTRIDSGSIVISSNLIDLIVVNNTANTVNYLTLDNTGLLTIGGGITFSGGRIQFADGSHISAFHGFGGTGSGTFSTGAPSTPQNIAFDPSTQSGTTQTIGGTLAVSSVVTTGAGLAWRGIAHNT